MHKMKNDCTLSVGSFHKKAIGHTHTHAIIESITCIVIHKHVKSLTSIKKRILCVSQGT
jgi:hypothetical protein